MASPITQPEKDRFIRVLRKTGKKSFAAQAVGRALASLQRLRVHDEDFDREWLDAEHDLANDIEEEAVRRAMSGVEEPVFHKGEVVGHINRRSDTLLIRMLEATQPDKFARRSKTDLSSTDGTMTPQVGDTELIARLSSIFAMAAARMENGDGD